MSFYLDFPVTPTRTLDLASLVATLQVIDATIGLQADPGPITQVTVKKTADFTAAEITDIQAAIDVAPELTPQRAAVHAIETWPPDQNALVYVMVDELNIVRAALVPPLPPLPYPEVFSAVKQVADEIA